MSVDTVAVVAHGPRDEGCRHSRRQNPFNRGEDVIHSKNITELIKLVLECEGLEKKVHLERSGPDAGHMSRKGER